MTSEIAAMNQRAIALAADSAVTMVDGGKIIIRNDQRKLFNLGEGLPVGVMFFGLADLMGHPWDVLIGQYAKSASVKDRLHEHGEDFFAYLDRLEGFFPPARQREEYRRLYASVLRFVFRLAHYLYEAGVIGPDEVLLGQAIDLVWQRYLAHPDGAPRADLACFPPGFAEVVKRDYGTVADEVIAYSFSAFPLDLQAREKLKEIAHLCVVKDLFVEDITGLAFAGYGAEDHYPGIVTYNVSAVVGGIVKRARADDIAVSGDLHSAIAIYAESEASYAFLRGIEFGLEREIWQRSEEMALGLVDSVVEGLSGMDPVHREAVRRQFQAEGVPQAMLQWQDTIGAFQQENYIEPMLAVLEIASKPELAETVEDLVALNILKKRITAQSPTVGGAIDVAVISREAGFSWVKRQGG
ncbi:hypothetical protein FHS83_003391 [Rhizomicrobium palustre]|uniref:Uncharacterized protein n=1 Tax=Rhizomicrobium palustre TaxID=189966 RepID=A0A846N384_9PROT|nr:hypothetical protein [Rhizomicrobium palustre]NIK90073.1 hypothetical protein [Rhizomicrobium palustre]